MHNKDCWLDPAGQGDEAKREDIVRLLPTRVWLSPGRCLVKNLIRSLALLFIGTIVPALSATGSSAVPPGVWLMGETVAIQIFDCSSLLCGRVVWLKAPLDAQGLMKRDVLNPDPALRGRQVCGPTIIWNVHANGSDRWDGGWFYNPDDGHTYRVSMELRSADLMITRIYLVLPIFGETRTLIRVPQGTSQEWC